LATRAGGNTLGAMEKIFEYATPLAQFAGLAIYWSFKVALIAAAVALWLALLTLWLATVWFVKGRPPRMVMRYF
jgi:hypothetical protein